ncbi:low-density lipoprotein receptor-related protein 6 [Amyelois transitella]|uniref:low-density lipoprotein receptor-related protein 6 n=1 Tax=Amyelois transitella TaxID=680683 RepID=UPI00299069A8|nr:low-density lipoprotein receptor-related protein 6 [Amyelois transitella]
MTKRRRILHADKIIQNVIHIFCLLMFLQLKGYYSVSSNPILLYSTANDIRVVNIPKFTKATAIVKDLEQGSAVDFIYRKSLICWSDQTAELIQCMHCNETHSGEKMNIVTEGLITPTGIAIDWYTDNIYWTDGETNRIEVISLEHKYRKVLFWSEVDLARAIAVVPKESLMFWTDWGEVPKIERAGMDGNPSTRRVIVKKNIYWPNGITIDYNKNLIYWIDAKLHFVDVIDFNGENRKRVVKGGLEYPYALTTFNDKLYWTDWKTWSLHTWDISSSGPIKEIIKSNPVPVDIKVYDASRQLMPAGELPCSVNNGGCSHLCLLSPANSAGYICACPTGVKLRENSDTTCYNAPQSLLLVAQRSMISKISLDSPDFTPYTLPLRDLKKILSVDFDPKTEYVYWADSVLKSISRARLDGSEQSVVIPSSGVGDSIAIDPLARNIYWTDPVADTINVARLDGSARKVLIHDELYDPRAIALHPTAGWMFWSDWNEKKPKIERANLDGTGRVLLVSEKLTWPNGIALDLVNNKLYWGDARTRKIEVCNMDGTNRKELHSADILHIFGVTLLGEHLYWSDMQRRTLDRINKNTGLDRQTVVEQMANMMGIKAFKLGEPLGWNRCADDNGGCSHLCFNRPNDYVCSCPLGLELGKDRKNCVEPEAFLLYSRKNVIGRISIENDDNDAVLPIKDLKEVSALAVHVSGLKLYWSDSKTKTISRCSINGTNIERILDWTGLVEGLAIDESAQNIYWTDTATQRIEVARLDGSSRRTLIWQTLKKPKSIALDPRKGFMYWSELGSKNIKRAGMDGSNPSVIIEQAGRAHALAIDYERRALFWAALDPPTIEYAFLNGTGRKTLISNVSMPYALTLYKDTVFWGDWNTGVVESAKKVDGSSRRRVQSRLDYISSLSAWTRRGSNQCGVDSGGCQHLCLPAPQAFRCACAAHYRLRPDNLTCSEPEEFLLFALKNSIGRLYMTYGECPDAYIPVTGLKNIKAIEYDPTNKTLYWIEEDSHSIRGVPISYYSTSAITDSYVVVEGIPRPFHMVLDVLGQALYWTGLDSDCINATSVRNTSLTGVIVRGENMMPRHLAFHQTKRFLIWNDVGLGAIMRSNVDGTGRVELARASNATALALDQATSIVYWAVSTKIYAVDLSDNKTRQVWQGGWVSALGAYGGALYLGAASGERALMRLPLHRRDLPAAPALHARAYALVAVAQVAHEHPCAAHPCGPAPGACGGGGRCGCGLACAPPPHCAPGHFLCGQARRPAAGLYCVPLAWRCDGQVDCPDGSDEAAAACGSCGGGVRCADGACAASLAACRAGALCAAARMPHAFRCDERLCISPHLQCDGTPHCEDGSDEAPANCVRQEAPGRQSSAFVVCGAIAGVAGGAFAAFAALKRWKLVQRRPVRRAAQPAARAMKPLHIEERRPLESASCTQMSASPCDRYPRPTANPPPSPATASGLAGDAGGGAGGAGGRRRAYRHYRAMNRVPPPTPASTDAADSEPEARAPPPSPAPCLY